MTQEYFESIYICLKLKTNTEKEIELQNSQRIMAACILLR